MARTKKKDAEKQAALAEQTKLLLMAGNIGFHTHRWVRSQSEYARIMASIGGVDNSVDYLKTAIAECHGLALELEKHLPKHVEEDVPPRRKRKVDALTRHERALAKKRRRR